MGFKENFTRMIGNGKLVIKKNSPEILLVAGIISGGAALATAVVSTLKVEAVLDEHIKSIEDAKAIEVGTELTDGTSGEVTVYTESTKKRVVALRYGRTAWSIAKLYAPTIIFTGLSLTCILTSHGIMRKRNVALAASLATVRTAFDEYRGRVVRDLGHEMDQKFLYDSEEKTIENETTDENGKKKKTKEKYQMPKVSSAYSRFFDESNPNWEKDGFSNYYFIRSKMLYLQNRLVRDGHLFLNDVYKELGLPITIAGQSAGWIYDFDNKESSQIFFEGFDVNEIGNSPAVRALMNGYERNCLINFVNLKDDILTDLPRVDSEVDAI